MGSSGGQPRFAVLGVAAVAAVASYEHAYDLVRAHGESGWTARLVPLDLVLAHVHGFRPAGSGLAAMVWPWRHR
jgi:hypothetical protein